MPSDSKTAKTLANLILHEEMPNSYYNDNYMVGCKTPDFDKIHREVPKLVDSPEILKIEVDGYPVQALVKLAINGGFEGQLKNPGKSSENYEMISQLYDTTKEDTAFWKEKGTTPVPENGPGRRNWILRNGNEPAALLAAQRMSRESFGIGDPSIKQKDMDAALALSKKLRHLPAFQKEFDNLAKYCRLQESYEKLRNNPQDSQKSQEAIQILKTTAKALAHEDTYVLSEWQEGPLGIEMESAVKIRLFTGKSNIPILEELIAQELKKPAPKTKEPEPEPA